MITNMPALTHEEQQKAVERIQDLMAQGISSGEAIAIVAEEIRARHAAADRSINKEKVTDE